ncbi:UDP-N-acetylmuramoyl-L-alanyl-D-glutamate--2,6-diaminopimelate ligase [Methylocapsa acidiphila]|uniref:UDP-N-acetylmuramoyl-L-alanyl-D-glutamate--2, 6-diaminopimelate ligase n=1 Tax=Methylocapsa acidiphila TaxID=133552 RepID=UPI00041F90FD|nr:UDP-N-acetylmuramoyl-L-alanyl-D-glutamate--2,6-diaminopimelate ligase [Methylocapsa acidiphila]
MRLAELFPNVELPEPLRGRAVADIAFDSRNVVEGGVFFAVPGVKADGLAFAGEAARRGAVVIVAERTPETPIGDAAFIKVEDARAALAQAAALLYPRQPETIVAITGTSGKTSVASFARQIWATLGVGAASLGTLGLAAPSGAVYGALTTPDPITLHKTLDALARDGVTHLALEASSHGIEQRRLDGVRIAAAGFTNLSRDHLDYHATLEDYLAAKLRLFEALLRPGQTAVVDADSDVADKVMAACERRGLRLFSVGRKGEALRLIEAEAENFSTRLRFAYGGGEVMVRLPLAGAFQASNALVAAGLCIASGSPPESVFAALERLEGALGRLELVGRRNGAPVFVDYAHKPDALDKVLSALRPFVTKTLVVVFGCGGDRDAGKRPIMGEVAARLADRVIVTDDNPRSEDPAAIRKAILAGAGNRENVQEIADRAAAISQAIALLEPGDGLVIAGKGHETGQIIGDRTLPFSDSDCARAALKEFAA